MMFSCITVNSVLSLAFIKLWFAVGWEFNSESHVLLSAGYSVLEEKKLLSHDEYTLVTGSPRNESKGSVTFGTMTTNSNIKTGLVIPGEQVGSYFGSSLAATDLNNDECVSEHWNVILSLAFLSYTALSYTIFTFIQNLKSVLQIKIQKNFIFDPRGPKEPIHLEIIFRLMPYKSTGCLEV